MLSSNFFWWLTCCLCPLCRVISWQCCSLAPCILTDDEAAHHSQSNKSHLWAQDSDPPSELECSSTQKILSLFLHSDLFYVSTRWPRPPPAPSLSQPPASLYCKLRELSDAEMHHSSPLLGNVCYPDHSFSWYVAEGKWKGGEHIYIT